MGKKGAGKGVVKKVDKQVQRRIADCNILPTIKHPSTTIGLNCKVLGSFWDNVAEADKEKQYICAIRHFDALHRWAGGRARAAFELQAMGESGEGSLEAGDASGEKFWIEYPQPFLKYFYDENPDKLPVHLRPTAKEDSDIMIETEKEAAKSGNGKLGTQTSKIYEYI